MATPEATPRLLFAAVTPMHVVGVDPRLARAHGYDVRRDARGHLYSVRRGAARGVQPNNELSGNCGSSWVYVFGLGNSAIELYTGYETRGSVAQWWWQVSMSDRTGTRYKTWDDGPPNSGYWSFDRVVGTFAKGSLLHAKVVAGKSFALLTSGLVCFSAGPEDTTTVV